MGLEKDISYMKRAYEKAYYLSQNPSTQTGAIVAHDSFGVLGFSANRLPFRMDYDESKTIRPVVYDWLDHAEEGAIRMAIRQGHLEKLKSSVLYTPWIPCSGCARDIVGYSIPEVVMHKDLNDFDKSVSGKNWGQDESLKIFDRMGVKYRFIEGKLFDSDFDINFRGKNFSP